MKNFGINGLRTGLEKYNEQNAAGSVLKELNSAESILIPKGEDMLTCIQGLAAVCGIEAPPYIRGQDERKSQGIAFRYAKGMDIPGWIAAGWADAGVTGTDSIAESPSRGVLMWAETGIPMCRYSLLVVKKAVEKFEYELSNAPWNGRRSEPLPIPATRPELLQATKGFLPVWPMRLPVRGSGELAVCLSPFQAGADLVKTGDSARRAGLVEYRMLAKVVPALVVRNTQSAQRRPIK